DRRHTILTKVSERRVHTHKGYVDLVRLAGLPYGSRAETNTGKTLYALRPSIEDYVRRFRHRTQIMYIKDVSHALSWMGVSPGQRVLEAGTGSGATAAAIANLVRPNGKVYSYDVNEESVETAKANLERVGLRQYAEIKLQDVYEAVSEEGLDSALLDLPEPWMALPALHPALKPSGRVVSFSPTINQVEKTVAAMQRTGFLHVQTIEILVRQYRIKEGMSRPEGLMLSHTGYLTMAVKVENR
ncbi:MAG: tRNA (adenine-N1)-methyltransferase, partial [Candidatus Brockarchaeota archaeon]|nr:tRNA (adenine-N1)-methyltransferase [Candidatus Brockarchaeota archaeon]